MREELDMAGQSLRDGCREVERLKVCLLVAETMLGASDGEAADARAAIMAAHAKLTSELNLFVSFAKLLLVLTLNLRISQRYKSS